MVGQLKFTFLTGLIFTWFFIVLATNRCLALDEGGCLTCHQYPGLVRLEKSDGFSVLHIDESKYLNSAHGAFRCEKCHTTVMKVPHTGERSVNCNSKCHQGGSSGKILPADSPARTLHKQEQSFIVSLKDKSSCRACHPLYPHSSNKLVRAFLNLHAGFMFCDVCHIKRDKFNGLTYAWENSENAEFSGEPFGTYYNPQTGDARKSEHFISRIAAFKTEKGQKQTLVNTWDTEKAGKFIEQQKKMKPEQKKKELAFFHRDIEKKEISVACNECHATDSILNFKQLGFDDKKTKHLIYLNIKGLVTKYKTFYFPHLFGD